MGVPGFFAWLLKNYKKSEIITDSIDKETDIFYIDANCLFHPQCYKIVDYYGDSLDIDKLEGKMIERILNYISYIIGLVNPKKEVFIAVDGVAPMGKINQQRKRRYKSVLENKIKNEIKLKYNKNVNQSWSNVVITPGTQFMEKLHKEIVRYLNKNILGLKIKYTYSSYRTPGEGEHKILQDIKKKGLTKDIYTIYGLDADLIFLSLASQKENIFLLREEGFLRESLEEPEEIIDIIKDVYEKLNFVSIDEMRKSINDQIYSIVASRNVHLSELEYDFSNDFIFICFLLGNDFVPNPPSLDIKNRGLELVLNCYVDTFLFLGEYIVTIDYKGVVNINNIFVDLLFENLSKFEENYFKNIYPQYLEYIGRRKCFHTDDYNQEIWKYDNLKNIQVHNPIQLGVDNHQTWKFRYYEYHYRTTRSQQNFIFNMCDNFLQGLFWTLKYYFEKCPSWEWQYRYHHAPFISDLAFYFNKFKYDFNIIAFPESYPITPFIQLLCVIPPSYKYILPSNYQKYMSSSFSPIIDLFPTNIKIDMLYKDSLHKCVPIIPNANICRIHDAIKKEKLNNEDLERNKEIENIVII
jgi:5'-3' exonuclease